MSKLKLGWMKFKTYFEALFDIGQKAGLIMQILGANTYAVKNTRRFFRSNPIDLRERRVKT